MKNYSDFTDYISKIPGISIIDVTLSDCVMKKIIHEYPNKQGFADLSYYFDKVNIYANRKLSLRVNVIGEGRTEIERENNAHEKITILSQYIMDKTETIDILISKYGGYFFTGVPNCVHTEEKKEIDMLGLVKATYEYLVEPEARKMIDGFFPLSVFETDGIGSFLSTCGQLKRPVYFYLKKKKPIIVYRSVSKDDLEKIKKENFKIIIKINGKTEKEITKNDIEINEQRGIFSFSINSTELNGGENFIAFISLTPYLNEQNYYLIVENNRL